MPPIELIAIPVDERFRRDEFAIHTAKQQPPIDDDTPVRFSLSGESDPTELKPQLPYRFYGVWDKANKYGPTFKHSSFSPVMPHGEKGIIAYLKQCRNVGTVTAHLLWEEFQGDAVKILRTDPERAAEAVGTRFSVQKAKEAAEDLEKLVTTENLTIELHNLFDGRGFGKQCIRQSLKIWGAKAVELLTRNPYKSLALHGVGFAKADKFYLDLGKPPARLVRQGMCLINAVKQESSQGGHVWVPLGQCIERLKADIAGADVRPERALEFALRLKSLVRRNYFGEQAWIGETSRVKAEKDVAKLVADGLAEEDSHWPSIDDEQFADLKDHQKEQLSKALAFGSIGILGGRPGTGKAQPLDANILTPTGWKKMGDIDRGDYVIGRRGLPIKVHSIHPQGERPVYRVVFSDGSATECTSDHLWLTSTRKERKNKTQHATVKTTKEIAGTLDRGDGSPNHLIPMVAPVEFNEIPLPVDPYLLGVILGDGCTRSGSVCISNPEKFIINELSKRIPDSCTLNQDSNDHITYRIVKKSGKYNTLAASLVRLNLMGKLSTEKHIPDAYKFTSVANRIALLQGLLDTDGYCDGHNVEYSTSSPALAEGVRSVVESLGGRVTISTRVPGYMHNGESRTGAISFRVLIVLPPCIDPFLLPRKAEKYIPRSKYPPRRYIVKIEPVGMKQCQCISVDADDGLYVTDCFIVTHNTYTMARLVKAIIAAHGRSSVCVCCPTGKAAVRCAESLAESDCSDVEPMTIHRTLRVLSADDGKGWSFHHGKYAPLPFRYIIVDESSMVAVPLLRSLLLARAKGACVLFIGDVNQLPPVDYGAPLRDMIEAGVPYGELTEIHRNAGTIVKVCSAICDGHPWEADSKLDLQSDDPKNMMLISAVPANAASKVIHLLEQLRDKSPFDAVWDVQVVVAVNKKSTLSRVTLNKRLQETLNPGPAVKDSPFRVDDKVIQLKNAYIPLAIKYGNGWKTDSDKRVMVANGEIGRVVLAERSRTIVAFDDKTAIIYRGVAGNGNNGAGSNGDDDSVDTGCDLDLAYAVTVHKAQGSQWPVIIYCLDEYPGATGEYGVVDKAHFYTGISRASKACFIVGRKHVAENVCRRSFINKRQTYLAELIRSYAKRAGVLLDYKIEDNDLW